MVRRRHLGGAGPITAVGQRLGRSRDLL